MDIVIKVDTVKPTIESEGIAAYLRIIVQKLIDTNPNIVVGIDFGGISAIAPSISPQFANQLVNRLWEEIGERISSQVVFLNCTSNVHQALEACVGSEEIPDLTFRVDQNYSVPVLESGYGSFIPDSSDPSLSDERWSDLRLYADEVNQVLRKNLCFPISVGDCVASYREELPAEDAANFATESPKLFAEFNGLVVAKAKKLAWIHWNALHRPDESEGSNVLWNKLGEKEKDAYLETARRLIIDS